MVQANGLKRLGDEGNSRGGAPSFHGKAWRQVQPGRHESICSAVCQCVGQGIHGFCRLGQYRLFSDQGQFGIFSVKEHAADCLQVGSQTLHAAIGRFPFHLLDGVQLVNAPPYFLKVNGSARYGIDVSVPGMLYATVKTCPVFGGRLKSFDDSAAKSMPGYHATVRLPDGVAVVATSYWRARKALDKVRVEYDPGPVAALDSDKVSAALRGSFDAPEAIIARNDGDAMATLENSATVIEAVYEVPYLAHACMEPMNCTADVKANSCEVWVSTQAPGRTRAAAAKTAGLPHHKVRVHSMFLGGGFGRRGEVDFVVQAVTVSRAVGRPVKLLWSREEDIRHDYYRPAAAIRFHGGVDRNGRVIALDARVVTASEPASRRPGPPMYTLGVADTAYTIPNYHVTGLNKDLGVPFGFWRSVNHSHNPYMMEGFIDELAYKLGQDPYLFRRSLLQGKKGRRHLGALDLAAHKAGWGKPLPPGHYLGIAATEAYGSWIANVAEVSVKDKVITLHKVVSAIDCGVAVNPETCQ